VGGIDEWLDLMRVPLVFDAAFVLSRVRVVDGCCCLRQGVFGFCLRRWRRLCFGGARQGHNRTHAQPAQVLGLLVLPVIVLVVEMVYVWRKCSSDQDNPKKLLPLGLIIIISQRSVRFAQCSCRPVRVSGTRIDSKLGCDFVPSTYVSCTPFHTLKKHSCSGAQSRPACSWWPPSAAP
jgi:hypothetical protein